MKSPFLLPSKEEDLQNWVTEMAIYRTESGQVRQAWKKGGCFVLGDPALKDEKHKAKNHVLVRDEKNGSRFDRKPRIFNLVKDSFKETHSPRSHTPWNFPRWQAAHITRGFSNR